MRSSSRTSLAAASDRLEPVLSTVDGTALGEQLFSVAGLLDSSPPLRKALTDPAREGGERAELARRLLLGKVAGTTVDLVAGLVRDRWSGDTDLVDALDRLGTDAVLAAAGQRQVLDQVEDELFRFSRVVIGDPALLAALDDRGAAPASRVTVVERLLASKVEPATLVLVRHAVSALRGRRIEAVLSDLLDAAAARRARLVAVVTAAVPLSESQRRRLSAALGSLYGRTVLLEVDVDPGVIGGLKIHIGDDVLDATTASRLAQLRDLASG